MRSARRATALALVACVAAVFAQAVRFPLLCWDDTYHLVEPLSLRTPGLGYPIPLTVASWAIFGRSPLAAHAGNVLLHAACALGLLALSWQLGRRAWPAFVFALHPLCAEPVAWATGRKDLLAAALVIAALLLHVRKPRPIATALLYVAALACKPSALPLPAILWAYDRLLAPERSSRWLFALAPIGALDLALAATGERAIGGVRESAVPLALRVPGAAGLEARHLFAPAGLLARYLAEPDRATVALGAIALATLAVLPFLLRRRAPQAAFAIAFAALAYLPSADLLHLARFVADSYLYLPLCGLALLFGSEKIPRWAPPALLALYLPLGFLQVRAWQSNVTLFQPVAAAFADSPTAVKQLGDAYVCDDRPSDAIPVYQSVETRLHSTIACGNLGLAWARLGNLREAEAAFTRGARGGDRKAAEHLAHLHAAVLPPSQ